MAVAFARSRTFWRVTARAAVVGVLSGLSAIAFIGAEEVLLHLLWGEDLPTRFGELGWAAVAVVIVGALLVGMQRRWAGLDPPDPNFVDEIMHGRTDPRAAAQLVLIGLTSLVGGASLGPEAPVATAGAGIGTAVGERGGSRRETADLTLAGISGAFGSIMTFPFAGPLLALELQEDREIGRYERLVPALVAATVATVLVYPVLGAPFVGLFPVDPPPLDLASIAVAVPLGLLGAAVGVLAVVAMAAAGVLFARMRDPVVRAVVGGGVVVAVAAVVPLTLFSGRGQLGLILEQHAALGSGLLLATLAGKLVVFAVCMRSGYFGGPIFPLLFLGGVTGVLVHQVVPAVPLSLAVATTAGGATIAALGLPFTVLVFVVVVFALGAVGSIAPAVAIVSAYVAVHGTGVLGLLARRLGPATPGQGSPDDIAVPRG